MSVVPKSKDTMIAFYENHIAPWTTNAAAIGTTAGAVTDLDTKTDAARAALTAQQNAQEAAKAATITLNETVEAMNTAGQAIIKQIRAKADMSGNSVYALAQIPVPATPTPTPPPGTPYQLKVELKPNGSLALNWKCDNPVGSSGTLYHVYRKVGTAPGEFTFIGGSGSRSFVDATVPAGTPTIVYQIQAARTTAVGDAAEFIVNLGVGVGGEMTASVTEAPPAPKMAA